jgi:hypothetical protein
MIQGVGSGSPLRTAPLLEESRMLQRSLGARLRQLFDEGMNEVAAAEFLEILGHVDDVDPGSDLQAQGRPARFGTGPDMPARGEREASATD